MKKVLMVVLIAGVGLTAYFLLRKKENKPAGEKQQPLSMGANTGTFNESFNHLLTAYLGVRDALFASDTAKASAAARQLAIAADSLKTDEIKGDSTGVIKETAKSFAGTISGSASGLAGERTLANKRKEFEMIADAMWSLTRTVKYSGKKLYWQHCPMAFDNKGAYWMSDEPFVRNPYFGNEMPECGSVEDSLDYSK